MGIGSIPGTRNRGTKIIGETKVYFFACAVFHWIALGVFAHSMVGNYFCGHAYIRKNQKKRTHKMKKLREILTSFTWVIVFLGFVCLVLFSFFCTGVNESLDTELVSFHRDNVLFNILGIFFFGSFLIILSKAVEKWKNIDALAIVFSLLASVISIYWVNVSKVFPVEDQAQIVNQAIAFNHGDYSGLSKGAYVGLCQHQLGIITLTRLIFKIFGENFRFVQIFSAIMVSVIIWTGYQLTQILSSKNKSASIIYLFLILSYFPMYIYVPYVYGEIAAIGFLFLAVWIYFCCVKTFRWWLAAIAGVVLGIAILLRQNSYIVLIAMIVITIFELLGEHSYQKKKECLKTILIIGMGVWLCNFTLFHGIYGGKIPEDSHSIPALLYIAMGCNTDTINPGNYNGYAYFTYSTSQYDDHLANAKAIGKIKEFLSHCCSDLRYACEFLRGKFEYQWNTPMEQSIVMNRWLEGESNFWVQEIYHGKWNVFIESYMNIWQLVVYLAGGMYVVMEYVRKKEFYINLIPIAIMGDICFSMLWEAKARYTLPFVMLMIPIAAVAFAKIMERKRNK